MITQDIEVQKGPVIITFGRGTIDICSGKTGSGTPAISFSKCKKTPIGTDITKVNPKQPDEVVILFENMESFVVFEKAVKRVKKYLTEKSKKTK